MGLDFISFSSSQSSSLYHYVKAHSKPNVNKGEVPGVCQMWELDKLDLEEAASFRDRLIPTVFWGWRTCSVENCVILGLSSKILLLFLAYTREVSCDTFYETFDMFGVKSVRLSVTTGLGAERKKKRSFWTVS